MANTKSCSNAQETASRNWPRGRKGGGVSATKRKKRRGTSCQPRERCGARVEVRSFLYCLACATSHRHPPRAIFCLVRPRAAKLAAIRLTRPSRKKGALERKTGALAVKYAHPPCPPIHSSTCHCPACEDVGCAGCKIEEGVPSFSWANTNSLAPITESHRSVLRRVGAGVANTSLPFRFQAIPTGSNICSYPMPILQCLRLNIYIQMQY